LYRGGGGEGPKKRGGRVIAFRYDNLIKGGGKKRGNRN